MRDWLLILGANIAVFVWVVVQAVRTTERQKLRVKFLELVREWDVAQRKLGYAIAEVRCRPRRLLWLECEAVWRNAEGQTHTGRAKL